MSSEDGVWTSEYKINYDLLNGGGHVKCWKFLTHPEGWIDNMGILVMLVVPIWGFIWILTQEYLPAIFLLGTCNIVSIAVSLLLLVPASREPSTYTSLKHLSRLLNTDPRMTPNSWRHIFTLGTWIFQLLVLGAVVLTECRLVVGVFLPEIASPPTPDHSLPYILAEQLSSSLVGNLITLALTTFSATFFGFSWLVGCFRDR